MPLPNLISNLGLPQFSAASTLAPHISLPSTGAVAHTSSSTTPATVHLVQEQPNIYAIPSIPDIPAKLMQQILNWKYTDLSELMPEQLRQETSANTSSSSQIVVLPEYAWETHRRKKRQIQDIAMWIQVYSIYMLILSTRYPEVLPELIGYQLLIVKHSRKFRYPSWLHYDIEFRKWAANNNHRRWSQLNQEIYALAFTGQGIATAWCALCQIEGGSHTVDCPNFSSPVKRPYLGSQSPPNYTQPEPVKKRRKVPYCILYNRSSAGTCSYGRKCIYRHICSNCGQEHPAKNCPEKGKQPTRQGNGFH